MDFSNSTIAEIATSIEQNWPKVNYAAKPYLDAMKSLDKISDMFYADSGYNIVGYFLSNAAGFRGEAAKAIKAELNKRLKK